MRIEKNEFNVTPTPANIQNSKARQLLSFFERPTKFTAYLLSTEKRPC